MLCFRLFWFVLLVGFPATSVLPYTLTDTLVLNRDEAETVFLQRNLRLLAGKLEINEAEARVIQARMWPNPTLSVGEINLWANQGAEELGRVIRGWGNHAQVAIDIEQVIQTAGKRKKEIALAKTDVELAEQAFADLLQSLKLEFRSQLAELGASQQRLTVYTHQLVRLRQLLDGYRRQVEQGNVAKAEYIRLKAAEMAFVKQIDEIRRDNLVSQQTLKVMIGVDAQMELVLQDDGGLPPLDGIKQASLAALIQQASENRPTLRLAELETEHAANRLTYEQAKRIPDLAVQVNYDRGGNIMRDFVGLGVAMNLPLFDKNKGNISAAQAGLEKSRLLTENRKNEVEAEVVSSWKALLQTIERFEQFDADADESLDAMVANYHRNFANRHISLVTYLDFLEAYLESKDNLLDTKRMLHIQYEALQYYLGTQ